MVAAVGATVVVEVVVVIETALFDCWKA